MVEMAILTTNKVNRTRQVTGLVLFAFVSSHFLNHALGLISLSVQEAGKGWFIEVWRFPLMSALFYGSVLIHILIALRALYRRNTLVMPFWEAAQLVLGLALPFLLIEHMLGTRGADELFGMHASYKFVVLLYWTLAPIKGPIIGSALLVAWVHGCIGLHFWLRLKPTYEKLAPFLLVIAVLLPSFALLGIIASACEAAILATDPVWVEAMQSATGQPNQDAFEFVNSWTSRVRYGFAALIAATLLARAIRLRLQANHETLSLTYPGDNVIKVAKGLTILEASRAKGLPHAAVCGGRGRCSTCRVRIGAGLDDLPPPDDDETRVLTRIGATPNIRLACQTRPASDTEVVPLLPPGIAPTDQSGRPRYLHGDERQIAILFADLRGFTSISENKLPYDVVFILNRYFAEMGTAIEDAGGYVDKFIGDGIMALFGIETGPKDGCRTALDAARKMLRGLEVINAELSHDLDRPLQIGIGIHVGPAVVGEMGHGRATAVTAIGDAVNTASRLESMTKDNAVQLIISEDVAEWAGVTLDEVPRREIEVRGKSEPISVLFIKDAATFASIDDGPRSRTAAPEISVQAD